MQEIFRSFLLIPLIQFFEEKLLLNPIYVEFQEVICLKLLVLIEFFLLFQQ